MSLQARRASHVAGVRMTLIRGETSGLRRCRTQEDVAFASSGCMPRLLAPRGLDRVADGRHEVSRLARARARARAGGRLDSERVLARDGHRCVLRSRGGTGFRSFETAVGMDMTARGDTVGEERRSVSASMWPGVRVLSYGRCFLQNGRTCTLFLPGRTVREVPRFCTVAHIKELNLDLVR